MCGVNSRPLEGESSPIMDVPDAARNAWIGSRTACLSALPRRSPDKFAIEGRRRSQKGERERERERERQWQRPEVHPVGRTEE